MGGAQLGQCGPSAADQHLAIARGLYAARQTVQTASRPAHAPARPATRGGRLRQVSRLRRAGWSGGGQLHQQHQVPRLHVRANKTVGAGVGHGEWRTTGAKCRSPNKWGQMGLPGGLTPMIAQKAPGILILKSDPAAACCRRPRRPSLTRAVTGDRPLKRHPQ